MRIKGSLVAFAVACAVSGTASAKGTVRLGDFLIDAKKNKVTSIFNSRGQNYGFDAVQKWFNGSQNGHPAYYVQQIAPGVVADRHGVLLKVRGENGRFPRVGSVVTVQGGTYQDSQVHIPKVRIKTQSFVVMRLDGKDRILIPRSLARKR